MANEDYQLEELENAAVNKSNNAKRAAAAAGLFVAGGATTYGATKIAESIDNSNDPILTPADIQEAVEKGVKNVFEEEAKTQSPHNGHSKQTPNPIHEPKPEPHPDPRSPQDMVDHTDFDKTTIYVDQYGHRIGTKEEGTVNGHKIAIADNDGDMRADIYAYDEDGNGVYNEDEITELKGKNQIAMGHPSEETDVKFINTTPWYNPGEDDEDDYSVDNNFEDEKTGESFKSDYAEKSGDYNNNAEADQYMAAVQENESCDQEYDDYDSLSSNETPTEDTFEDLGSDALDIV